MDQQKDQPKAPAPQPATGGRDAGVELLGAGGGGSAAAAQSAELASFGGAAAGAGAALPEDVRKGFEGSLGASLDGVRVHADEGAGMKAAAMGAKAFAEGQDIYGSPAALDAGTAEGRMTLAHEVVHTVQSAQGGGGGVHARSFTTPGSAVEAEAEAGAQAMVAGQPFTVRSAGTGAAVARDKASVSAKLDETPFNAAELLALLRQQSQAEVRDILGDSTVTDKLVAKLSGAQMERALVLLWSDPTSWGNDFAANRLNLLRRAGGTRGQGQRWISAADEAARARIAENADLRTWLGAGSGGALGAFPPEARGLSGEALASGAFMQWILGTSPAQMILAAAHGSVHGAATVVAAIDANGGWGWLSQLPDGAGLTADQMSALQDLAAGAPAGTPARTTIEAKLAAAPLAQTPQEAFVQLIIRLVTPGSAELELIQLLGALDQPLKDLIKLGHLPQISAALHGTNLAQGLMVLGLTPVEIARALQAAGVHDGGAWMSVMATAPLDQRLAVADDATAAAYVAAIPGGLPMASLYGLAAGEEAQFFAKAGFAKGCLDGMVPADALLYLTDRTYIAAFATYADAHAADVVAWIDRLPPADQRHTYETTNLRALAVACNNAAIDTKVGSFLGDRETTTELVGSEPVPAEIMQGPLERLDHLLDTNGAPGEIISMCGALVHPENHTVVNDGARVAKIARLLDADQYAQACAALRLVPKWQIKFLMASRDQSGPRIQTIINQSSEQEKLEIIGWDAVVEGVKTALPGALALNVFGYAQQGPPVDALRRPAFRSWLLDDTPPGELLRVFAADDAAAVRYAGTLDTLRGWGWLGRLQGGNALIPAERAELERLQRASCNIAALDAITGLLGDTSDTMAPADALTTLQNELNALLNTDEDLCLRCANQLDDGQRATMRGQVWMVKATAAFNGEEMSRYVQSLQMPLSDQVRWLRAASGGRAAPEHLQALINRAPPNEQLLVIIDDDTRAAVRASLPTSPLNTLPAVQPVAAQLFPGYWDWLAATETPLGFLAALATGGAVAVGAAMVVAGGHLAVIDRLPRGTGLTGQARGHCDTVMMECLQAEMEKHIFAVRFDQRLTGDWTQTDRDDLKQLYERLRALPIEHVVNNPRLVTFNREHGGGGTYSGSENQVNIGADLTYEWEQYADTAGAADPADRWNQMVRKFDTTTRHEVGHAVDAMMGERTSIVYDWAGWHAYAEGDLERWIQAMNGWDAGGGDAPTPDDKTAIREVIRQYMNAGKGSIGGPGYAIGGLVGPDHAWNRFGHVRIVDLMTNNRGLLYSQSYRSSSHIFSANYYYNRWMQVKATAGDNMPRAYSTFAPEEWFADMYGEFYREYDGTPATENKLGGHCPEPVKQWFMTNVHRIGRSPHDLEGQSTSGGTRAPPP